MYKHPILKFLESSELDELTKENIKFKKRDKVVILDKLERETKNDLDLCCKGLIVDDQKVVCHSINNSITYKNFKEMVPFRYCIIEENLDGTLINVYYYDNEWKISTRFNIDGDQSRYRSNKSYGEILRSIIDIESLNLDKKYTYSFVLNFEENRHVKRVEKDELYHIETTNNISGEKYYIDIGINHPKILYNFKKKDNELEITDYNALEKYMKSLPWDKKGVMLYSIDRKFRCNFKCVEYEKIENLVKNQRDVKYILLEGNYYKKNIDEILKYYPEWNKKNEELMNDLERLLINLEKNYIKKYCKKENPNIREVDERIYRNLHTIFKRNRETNNNFILMKDDIRRYMLRLDCKYLYTILYK